MRDHIQAHILTVLASGPKSLIELALHCRGVFPAALKSIIDDMENAGAIRRDGSNLTAGSIAPLLGELPNNRLTPEGLAQIPEPHQANYEWRFTPTTAQQLFKKATVALPRQARLCYLGTPTVYLAAMTAYPHYEHLLIDTAVPIIEFARKLAGAQVLAHDLAEGLPPVNGGFHAVFMDPPWYPEHYPAFIKAASHLLIPGGNAYMSLFPLFVRPSAPGERARIVQQAAGANLALLGLEAASLTYSTPPFEEATLSLCDLHGYDEWRTADLLVFTKIDHNTPSPAPPAPRLWKEWTIGTHVIKIRQREHYASTQLLEQLPGGSVLPTVSRTHPELDDVDVWTSRNRVFRTSNAKLISRAITLLQTNTRREETTMILTNDPERGNAAPAEIAAMVDTLYRLVQE